MADPEDVTSPPDEPDEPSAPDGAPARTRPRIARVYAPLDRPDVEVLYAGGLGEEPLDPPVWCPGELRQWKPVGTDGWIAEVAFRRPGMRSPRISDFAPDEVRPDTIDRSHGRTTIPSTPPPPQVESPEEPTD